MFTVVNIVIPSGTQAETYPYNQERFQFEYLVNSASSQTVKVDTAFPVLKFKRTTVFLDADVSANKSSFSSEGSGFQFSRSILALGAEYKSDTSLEAEARAYVSAEKDFQGYGVKTHLSKYWDANSFTMRGFLQKGKRDGFVYEETESEFTDQEGNVSTFPSFEYVEKTFDETKSELSANLYLSGGKLPEDVRLFANGRFSKTSSEQNNFSSTSFQLTYQQDFGEFLKYTARPRFITQLNYTSNNKLSIEASYERPVIDRQKIQA
ncbi:MAG: hypothetical protein ACPGVN_04390, partial [Alphaproteobacteria bacterium]